MNHPFFHIPAYYKEILIIGDKTEVYKAEAEIYKFLREEKKVNNQNIYTLSILIPFTIQPEEYNTYVDRIKEKYMVDLQTYEAIPPRKHATAMLIGTWENVCLAKDMMVDWVEKQRNMQMSRWTDYDKFDKMILNQQIRFTYKSLKRYIIEKHVKYLKHWDLTSHTVVRELSPTPPDEEDKEKKAFHELAKGETDSLQYFMKQVDSETAINVLFATNSEGEFERLMDKYDLKKREIIEKCYELLNDNMREYNFLGPRTSRYGDSYHYNSNYHESYYNSNRYEFPANKYYGPHKSESTSRFSGGSYHQDKYSATGQETTQPYSGRFKNLFSNTSENESAVVKNETESQEKHRSSSREDRERRHSSRYKYPSFYRSSRDKYDRRSRHYVDSDKRDSYSRSHRSSSRRSGSHSRSRRHRHY